MNQISLLDRKKMRTKLIFRVYLFTLIVVFPLTVAQELFFLPIMIPKASLTQNFFLQLHQYLKDHYIYFTYSLLIICVSISIYMFCKPYIDYIITGDNKEDIQKRIINPLGMLSYFLIVPNICNFINLVLDFEYISSLPLETIVYFFLFKIIWQFLICFLTIFYFLSITKQMRDTLELYRFQENQISFFASYKNMIFVILEFVFLFIIIFQTSFLIDQTDYSFSYIKMWGICMIILITFLTTILLIYQNVINIKIYQRMYVNFKSFVDNGKITSQNTYYERSILGHFESTYNSFIDDIHQNMVQNSHSITQLNNSQNILKKFTQELSRTLHIQEFNVAQMNIAINTSSTAIQYLLGDIDRKSHSLEKNKMHIDNLIHGIDSLLNIFSSLQKAYEVTQNTQQDALISLDHSLEKNRLMNQEINKIHQQIQLSGQETSAIDEVLNVINKIAEQTNLLSMSAAIEAAHGDSHSRQGFTLVAEEIRELSQISQESVSKIATRLSTIKDYISEAYELSKEETALSSHVLNMNEQLASSLSQINDYSQNVSSLLNQIDPIITDQNSLNINSQKIIQESFENLRHIFKELQNNSASTVMLSLNFRSMNKNFQQNRSALYHAESAIEKLMIIKNQLQFLLDEFHIYEQNNNNEQNYE